MGLLAVLSSPVLTACQNQSKQEKPDQKIDNQVAISRYEFGTYPGLLKLYSVYERKNSVRFILSNFNEMEGDWYYFFIFKWDGRTI